MATKLDLMDAQFIGYSLGKGGSSVIELIESAGKMADELLKQLEQTKP